MVRSQFIYIILFSLIKATFQIIISLCPSTEHLCPQGPPSPPAAAVWCDRLLPVNWREIDVTVHGAESCMLYVCAVLHCTAAYWEGCVENVDVSLQSIATNCSVTRFYNITLDCLIMSLKICGLVSKESTIPGFWENIHSGGCIFPTALPSATIFN